MAGPTGESGAGRWALRARRGWWLIALGASVMLWWALGPLAATREVRVRVPEDARGWDLSVRWEREGGRGSGAWVDGTDERGLWVERMPLRGVRRARLEWRAAARGAPVAVQVGVEDRVLGVPVSRTWADAALAGEGGSVALELPRAWRAGALDAGWAAAAGLLLVAAWRSAGRGAGGVPGELPRGEARRTRWEWFGLAVVCGVHAAWAWRAPMMFCPDSMDYAVRARELLETRSFAGFDAWRPPGFAVLLAGLTGVSDDVRCLLGGMHAGMAVLTAGMAGAMVRRFAGSRWAAGAVVLVGLDPLVLLWTRHAMPEMSAMFLATLAAWLAVGAVGRARAVPWAALAGAAAGLAALMRGNLQMLAPVLAGMVWLGWDGGVTGRWRGRVVLAGACVAGAGVVLGPWVGRNGVVAGEPRLVVGTQFARLLNAADAGLIDLNQATILARGEIGGDKGGDDGYALARRVHTSAWGREGEFRDGAGLHRWAASEARLEVVVTESLERRPERAWRARGEAFVNLAGLVPLDRKGYRENAWWAGPLEGDAAGAGAGARAGNFWNRPEDYAHLDRARAAAVYAANRGDITGYQQGWGAWAFGRWRRVGGWVRVGLAWAGLLGCVWAARRGGGRWAWAAAALLAVPFLHAGAVVMVTLSGIDRYQAPMVPLTVCGGLIALGCAAGRVLGRGARVVTAVTGGPGGAG